MALNKYTKGGSSGLERKLDAIVEDLYKLQIVNSPTVQVDQRSHGTTLNVNLPGGGGSKLHLFRFKSMADDHLICRSFDGEEEGDTDVLIAKRYELRKTGWHGQSVTYQIPTALGGGTKVVTYTYLNGWERTAVSSGVTEHQVIFPQYIANKTWIWAESAPTGIAGITLLESGESRAFTKVA